MWSNILGMGAYNYTLMYSTTEPATLPSRPLFLSTMNITYKILIYSQLTKELAYNTLVLDLEATSFCFLYI